MQNNNFAADSFHTKKLYGRLSSREMQFYSENSHFAFLSPPPLGGLETTYAVLLGLIRRSVVDFLLMIIEVFSPRVTAEVVRANID